MLLFYKGSLGSAEMAVCEMNCLEIVDSLAQDTFRFHIYARDFLEIHEILARNWEVCLRHVPR